MEGQLDKLDELGSSRVGIMLPERNTLSLAALKAGLVLAFAWKLGFISKASPLSQITPDQSMVSTSLYLLLLAQL